MKAYLYKYEHEDYIFYTDDIYIEVNGDIKNLYVPAEKEISLELIATDNGTMTYTIEQIDCGKKIGRLNYYDVPLIVNEKYTQQIPANIDLIKSVDTLLLNSTQANIKPNEYLSAEQSAFVTIKCTSTEGGIAFGEGEYAYGDCVELIAINENEDMKIKETEYNFDFHYFAHYYRI